MMTSLPHNRRVALPPPSPPPPLRRRSLPVFTRGDAAIILGEGDESDTRSFVVEAVRTAQPSAEFANKLTELAVEHFGGTSCAH